MDKKEQLIERYHPDTQLLFADGFNDAILGVDNNQWDKNTPDLADQSKEKVVYSVKKIIQILMTRDGMDYETAREHFDFNISGGYVGVHTPVFVEDEDLSDESEQDITEAWNEIEEFLTDERELSAEELRNVHDVMIARLNKALTLLGKYVPDQG